MIVEILGARMLAPYLGTSHFVWTAQIAVTLVALTFGYYLGGRWADRHPRIRRLYAILLIAACYLTLTLFMVQPIALWALRFNLAVAALITASFLFFIPLALMAMAGPFLVRFLTSSLQNVGGQVGRLTAVSTAGSVVGTMAVSYLLIPWVPNSFSVMIASSLLVLVSLFYFLTWEWPKKSAALLILLVAANLYLGYRGLYSESMKMGGLEMVETRNSPFGLLQVFRTPDDSRRYFLNDLLTQNTYDPLEKKSFSSFTYLLSALAWAYNPRLENALCIGMGVGIVPMEMAREGVKMDVVEINPQVLPLATNHFDFEPARVTLHFQDGRYFLGQTTNRYDAILLDAFLGDSSPGHLMSKESFAAIKRALKPEGVLVINSFGTFESGRDYFTASLEKTLRAVFGGNVRVHAMAERRSGNVMFAASASSSPMRIQRLPDFNNVHPGCRGDVERIFKSVVESNPRHGLVLSDDYNPVEVFDSANREEFRRYLVDRVRGKE